MPRAALLAFALAAGALVACGQPPAALVEAETRDAGAGDPTACFACHAPEYHRAREHEGKKPETCGVCHAQETWRPTRLAHPWWALTGKHAKAECSFCHEGTPPKFRGTSKACFACHAPEYDKAPGHAGHRPTTCETCHSTDAWKPPLPTHEAHEPKEPEPQPEPAPEPPKADAGAPREPKPAPSTTAPKQQPKPPPRPTATTPVPPNPLSGASRRR